ALRPRQGPALRTLHDALRLRADRGAGRQREARRRPEDADVAVQLTAVLFALRREARPFLRRLRGRGRGRAAPGEAWRAGGSLLVLVTSMGEPATERALGWLLGQRPAHIVTAGYCGSLVPERKVGEVVAPAEVVDTGGERWSLGGATSLIQAGTL